MKAILVIDMPEKCEECLLYNGDCCCADIQWYLTGELGHREVWHPEKRQDWCPLKPIVFCEECKYADELGEWSKYDYSCRHFNTHSVNKGNFCSYGEKKDESNSSD